MTELIKDFLYGLLVFGGAMLVLGGVIFLLVGPLFLADYSFWWLLLYLPHGIVPIAYAGKAWRQRP